MRILILALIGLLCVACTEVPDKPTVETQRQAQEEQQVSNQERAEAMYPIPQPSDFATRRNVQRWTEEVNQIKPWYNYIYVDGVSTPLGFFISDSPFTSYCAFLAPPEQVLDRYGTDVVVSAPGIDGVYYGKGNCNDTNYFFDEATGSMVQIKGFNLITTTNPIDLDVPKLEIVLKGEQ